MTQLTRTKLDELHDEGRTGIRHWLLSGPQGAVQITFTKLPEFPGHFRDEETFPGGWLGIEFGYHALTPQEADATARACDHVPGGRCYFSGSAVPAMDLVREWWDADRDDEVIWLAAELGYRAMFLDDGQEERQP